MFFFSIDQHQPGILIYEMIVGYPPFVDEDPHLDYDEIWPCGVQK